MEKKGLILGWHQWYLLDDMHVELIRNGFKDKAYGMPLFALGLDIVCEFLYSIDGFSLKRIYADSDISDLAWAFCDVTILVCWLRYVRQYLTEKAQRHFIPSPILALLVCAYATPRRP